MPVSNTPTAAGPITSASERNRYETAGRSRVLRFFPGQENAATGADAHVEIVWRQIHVTRQGADAVSADVNLEAGRLVQPLRQAGQKAPRDVLHDEDGHRKSPSADPPGSSCSTGGPPVDAPMPMNLISGGRGLRFHLARDSGRGGSRSRPRPAPHDFDLGHQFDRLPEVRGRSARTRRARDPPAFPRRRRRRPPSRETSWRPPWGPRWRCK